MTRALYTWKDDAGGDIYGHKLATDSAGRWIMEPKGGGAPVAIEKDAAERVLPFSISIRFHCGSTAYDYWAKVEDGFAVGDMILMHDGQVAVVCAVGVKSDRANKWITGVKVAGTPLTPGE